MTAFSYRLTGHASAEPEVLFDLIADAPGWPRWTKLVPTARWEDPERTGVGGVRLMGSGPLGMREEILVEERPARHEYGMPATFPARNYRSTVTFTPAPSGGTDVVWAGRFEAAPGIGHAYCALLRKVIISRLLKDLIRAGDRSA